MKVVVAAGAAVVMFMMLLVVPLLGGGSSVPPQEGIEQALGGDAGASLAAGQVPGEYLPYLTKASGAYCPEITAPALAAQIKAESAWNANARSPVGAAGPSQFMPGTWSEWGRDANGNGTTSPLELADAIDAQARFMCSLIGQMKKALSSGRVKGDLLTLAWASYNAGPGAVLRARGVPGFAETQGYVVKLRTYMQAFTATGAASAVVVKVSGKIMNPLQGQPYRLVSGFGPRPKPCATCSSQHQGQDLAIATGAPLRSACTGRVVHADASGGSSGGLGRAIVVDCGGGIRMLYGHNSNLQVRPGQEVKTGDVMGATGNTGASTGPHLHFEVHTGAATGSHWYSGGTAVDPMPWMKKNGAAL